MYVFLKQFYYFFVVFKSFMKNLIYNFHVQEIYKIFMFMIELHEPLKKQLLSFMLPIIISSKLNLIPIEIN